MKFLRVFLHLVILCINPQPIGLYLCATNILVFLSSVFQRPKSLLLYFELWADINVKYTFWFFFQYWINAIFCPKNIAAMATIFLALYFTLVSFGNYFVTYIHQAFFDIPKWVLIFKLFSTFLSLSFCWGVSFLISLEF